MNLLINSSNGRNLLKLIRITNHESKVWFLIQITNHSGEMIRITNHELSHKITNDSNYKIMTTILVQL